jgi:uncharacterized membrane protein
LIFLEFTVINFALWFDIHFRILLFQVIAAMGFGFIILSFMLKMKPLTIGIIGLAIIFLHNLFPLIPFGEGSVIKQVLSPVITFNLYKVTPQFTFVVGYPFLPWFGIMLAGFASGGLFNLSEKTKSRVFPIIGTTALILFVVLRYINLYGEQSHWAVQKNSLFTLLSFINVSKYPPSLLFILLTTGVMFLLLSLFGRTSNRFTKLVSVYGRVPFFYYLIHLYLIHGIMLVIMFLQGYHWPDLSFEPFRFGRAADSGIALWEVYLVWLSVIAVLYPLCLWYGKYKSAHREKIWLRYL